MTPSPVTATDLLPTPSPDDAPDLSTLPTVSVVICAYTLDRWDMLCEAIASAADQTHRPVEIWLSIDHNREMFDKAQATWPDGQLDGIPFRIVENAYDGRLGSARWTASEQATGEVIAYLDDDAAADRTWLQYLVGPYRDDNVLAVGGAPIPNYGAERPAWFPHEFNWVFGCYYIGLPDDLDDTPRLIGASMSVRREKLVEIGGFHSDNHDDMDMCHRLHLTWPEGRVMLEPRATVRHFVHPERLTWSYFWQRCYKVNVGKVTAHKQIEQDMPGATNLAADASFARRTLLGGTRRELRAAVTGDASAVGRIGAMVAGVGLAGVGYGVGTFKYWRAHR